jgi:enoyl-CoA hydratase/carnithine racemase
MLAIALLLKEGTGMQQAYRALRVISEAQTVHIVLASRPGALMLAELSIASAALQTKSSGGIKAVILDFAGQASAHSADQPGSPAELARARTAVRAIPQPVLAVARAGLSPVACELLAEADFTLVAHEAELCLPESSAGSANSIGGVTASTGWATLPGARQPPVLIRN